MADKRGEDIKVRVTAGMLAALDKIADDDGTTRSEIARRAIRYFLLSHGYSKQQIDANSVPGPTKTDADTLTKSGYGKIRHHKQAVEK